MTFEPTRTEMVHSDYHLPVWFETGTEDGQPAYRVVRMSGPEISLTCEEGRRLQYTFDEITRRAQAEKYAAVAALLSDSDRSTAAEPRKRRFVELAELAEQGARFYIVYPNAKSLEEFRPDLRHR
ncbi:hypothetical protein [Nocardia brevicatena]|uniref:hypothetical protein n=1 Tax=Nocardia brevicatena TaxID=37327 RepID=UPI00059252BC|nr:hypothetical protein [Nocardia brevicatena]